MTIRPLPILLALATLPLATAPAAAQRRATPRLAVRAENPLAVERSETLALPWASVRRRLPGATAARIRVRDAASGAELPAQALDADGDGAADSLLFIARFAARQTRRFAVEAAAPEHAAAAGVHAKYIPGRDDVAWESDRIAFRTYGQGLWKLENTHSSGVDVWTKRVRALVLDRWYGGEHPSYHTDRGEGADLYKVGATLGTGGTGIWRGGTLFRAENFRRQRILADGPVRALIELEYDPFDAGGARVTESRRISIDAGENLYRATSTFRYAGADSAAFATGTVKRPGLRALDGAAESGGWRWFGTWGPMDPAEGGTGELGTAVVLPAARHAVARETANHFLAVAPLSPGEPVVFYAGAGWTNSGDFAGAEAWTAYLRGFVARLDHPVRVTVHPAAR